jgi:nickel/cobalt exporter
MKKVLLFLMIFTYAFSCDLCKVSIPSLGTKVQIKANENDTSFSVQWTFNENFLQTLAIYDENENDIFDKSELEKIKKVLEDYIINFNYLTHIKYISNGIDFKNFKPITINNIENSSMIYSNNTIIYNFDFILPIIIASNHKMDIQFYDPETNFNFVLEDVLVQNYLKDKSININSLRAQLTFGGVADDSTVSSSSNETITDNITEDKSIKEILSEKLTTLKNELQKLLEDIKNNNSYSSYALLFAFSFLYGILHAIGPGHGKSLVSAYFLGHNKSYTKAFNVAAMIGVVHTFSAFIITFIIYYTVDLLLASHLTNIESVAIKISAVVIIAIALYLIYKKYKQRQIQKNTPQWSTHEPTCGCNACHTESSDVGVVLAAGIVPCPGTVTVFIFTLSLGLYFVGFVSAIFMSLGMSVVIFVTAYLSKNIRDKATKNSTLVKLLEYGSLVFILLLGFFLLLAS